MTSTLQTRPYPSDPSVDPSAKFVGRPAKPCSKCRGSWHWVNTMGGISCVQCQPAPPTITDIESRWLVVDGGRWEQPDDFVNRGPASTHSNQPQGTASSDHAGLVDLFAPSSWLLDVFTNDASIDVNRSSRTPAWTTEHQELVTWWMNLTTPNSQTLTATIARLQGQRLSRWCIICDARLMVEQLRVDCATGADGPREIHGCLIDELQELQQWMSRQQGPCLIDLSDIEL